MFGTHGRGCAANSILLYESEEGKKEDNCTVQLYQVRCLGCSMHALYSSEVSVTDTPPPPPSLSAQLGTEGIECHTVNPRNPDMPPPPPDSDEGRDGENT